MLRSRFRNQQWSGFPGIADATRPWLSQINGADRRYENSRIDKFNLAVALRPDRRNAASR